MIRDSESFNILLDTLARFVRERLIPAEQQVVDSDEIPAGILNEMRGMGLFRLFEGTSQIQQLVIARRLMLARR